MRKFFDPKLKVIDLNLVKSILTALGAPFSETELRSKLKERGLPHNNVFVSELKSFKILHSVDKGLVEFSTKGPIYYKTLQAIYSSYRKRMNEYGKRYRDRKKIEDQRKSTVIESAIKLLKENGYEVYAPVGNLYSKI